MLLFHDHNLTLMLHQNGETRLVKNFGDSRVLSRMNQSQRRAEVRKWCEYKFNTRVAFV